MQIRQLGYRTSGQANIQQIFFEIINPGNITGKLTEKLSRELIVGQIPVVAVAEHEPGSAVISVPS